MEVVSSENLKKLLIVISKEDFLLNFDMEEKEYKWLEKAFDIPKEKSRLNKICPEVRKIDKEKLRNFREAENSKCEKHKKTANQVFKPRGEKKKAIQLDFDQFNSN